MARDLAADDVTFYRAVISQARNDGIVHTFYEGPYTTAAAARSRVGYWRTMTHLSDRPKGVREVVGWVESGTLSWSSLR